MMVLTRVVFQKTQHLELPLAIHAPITGPTTGPRRGASKCMVIMHSCLCSTRRLLSTPLLMGSGALCQSQ
jgi:hypothetical protein